MCFVAKINKYIIRGEPMNENYIKKIVINEVRHLRKVTIDLGDEFRHLILTGSNGSGKTSVLKFLSEVIEGQQKSYLNIKSNSNIPKISNIMGSFSNSFESSAINENNDDINISKLIKSPNEPINIVFSKNENEIYRDCIFIYLPSKRYDLKESSTFRELKIPLNSKYLIEKSLGVDYIDYMKYLHFYAKSVVAKEYRNEINNIGSWFDFIESILRKIFNDEHLSLSFAPELWTFRIETKNRNPFTHHEMADGHSVCFKLFMEIMMRFHFRIDEPFNPNVPCILLVDEIDIHLHVEMQRNILPLLTSIFQNIQIIATTHSPFVISSSKNSITYDLESQNILEEPHLRSYQSIIETHYDIGLYSKITLGMFNRYKELYQKQVLTTDEENEIENLASELIKTPPSSSELYLAINEMEVNRKQHI